MKIKLLSIFAIALSVTIIFLSLTKNDVVNVSAYSIFEEITFVEKVENWIFDYGKDMRKHSIIRITRADGDITLSCSAFVINDTTALTAGHCLDVTEMFLKTNHEKINKQSKLKEEQLLREITRLEVICGNNAACLRKLAYLSSILTKELASRKKALGLKADIFNITDINGIELDMTATAHHKGKIRDYGFIIGNFKSFKKMSIRSGWHVKRGDILKACGFFGGKTPPSCVDFEAIGNKIFKYAGHSLFVPGVSGGPVVDHLGYVVGIASAASNEFVLMEPIIGIVNIISY